MIWPAVMCAVVYLAYLIGVVIGYRLRQADEKGIYEPPSHVQIRKREVFDYDKDA